MREVCEYSSLDRRESIVQVCADMYGGDLRAMREDLSNRLREKAYILPLVRRIKADIAIIDTILPQVGRKETA